MTEKKTMKKYLPIKLYFYQCRLLVAWINFINTKKNKLKKYV